MVEILLKRDEVDVDTIRDGVYDRMTTSPYEVHRRFKRTAELLLKRSGIDLQATEPQGWTALHYAVASGEIETTAMLLKRSDIDLQATDSIGWTALY